MFDTGGADLASDITAILNYPDLVQIGQKPSLVYTGDMQSNTALFLSQTVADYIAASQTTLAANITNLRHLISPFEVSQYYGLDTTTQEKSKRNLATS